MGATFSRFGAVLVLCGWPAMAATARADGRPAGAILAEIKGVEIPGPGAEKANVEAAEARRREAMNRRSALIGELYRAAPDDPELATLLPERWQTLMTTAAGGDATAKAEADEVLARSKDGRLLAEAAFRNLLVEMWKPGQGGDVGRMMGPFEEFARRAPDDPRVPAFLAAIAGRTADAATRKALHARIVQDYPSSPTGRSLINARRQVEGIGKPFEIAFTDAIKGAEVTSAGLKGKVVIVDFWATWCGPCVAEMPALKKLYAEYQGQGVEFIGVSLDEPRDQGGYDKLREYVDKNRVDWPQFYDGKTLATDFATAWGVQAIPACFAVDAEGNLASTEARGQLGRIIPELLARARKPAAAGR